MNAQSLKEEKDVYEEFVITHPKSRLEYQGQTIEYIACGHGMHTVLIPPHISGFFRWRWVTARSWLLRTGAE